IYFVVHFGACFRIMDNSDSTKSHYNLRALLSTRKKCFDFLQNNQILASNNNAIGIATGLSKSSEKDCSNTSKHSSSSSLPKKLNIISQDNNASDLSVAPSQKIHIYADFLHTTSSLPSTFSSSIRSYFDTSHETGSNSGHESSNTSSSGISSRTSNNSNKSEDSDLSEIDFSIGFTDGEDNIPNLDDINAEDEEQILQKNADTLTIIGNENSNNRCIEDFDDLLNKYDPDNEDDEDSSSSGKQTTGFLNSLSSSTNTLYAEHFSLFTEGEDQEANGLCRSNSLKIIQPIDKKFSEKAPKKVVRFADVMGLDLESIRYMTPPGTSVTLLITDCIKTRLEHLKLIRTSLKSSNSDPNLITINNNNKSDLYLVSEPFFSPTNIVQQVYERQVVLECLYIKDISAYGTVRVNNCSFNKKVFVRSTIDQWKTYNDIQAMYNLHNSNDNTDSFTFELTIPDKLLKDDTLAQQNTTIFFAVYYQVMGKEYWDNNFGSNYFLNILKR
ncbi:unnamed protein product, partial [Didymodactylos carnosus]